MNKKIIFSVLSSLIILFSVFGNTFVSRADDEISINYNKDSILTQEGYTESGGSTDVRYGVLLSSSNEYYTTIYENIENLLFPSGFELNTEEYYYFSALGNQQFSGHWTINIYAVPKSYIEDYGFALCYVEGNIAFVSSISLSIGGWSFDYQTFEYLGTCGFSSQNYTGAYDRHWNSNIGNKYILTSEIPLYSNYSWNEDGMYVMGSAVANGGGYDVIYSPSLFASDGSSEGYSDDDILNNDYVGNNCFVGITGSSISNADIKLIVDLNKEQLANITDYSYQMDISLYVKAQLSTLSNLNIKDYYGIVDFGDPFTFDKVFHDTINDSLSSNVTTISSNIYNDGLIDSNGKTAVRFVNWVEQNVDKDSVNTSTKVYKTLVNTIRFVNPKYVSSENANFSQLLYDITVNVYKGDKLITNVPIASKTDFLSGSTDLYSKPSVSEEDVNTAVNNNNEGLTPSDEGYKNPSNYEGSVQISNEGSSSSSTGGNVTIGEGAIVNNNNPTITINTGGSSGQDLSQTGGTPNKFILSTFIDWISNGQSATTESIENLTQVNPWLSVVQSTWSFVPGEIWSTIGTTFIAVLTILVVACIIKVCLKIFLE